MLTVQHYLWSYSLADLAREHGVYAKFSTKNPLKFSLNYDQLEAKDADPIAQECRGTVLYTTTPVNMTSVVGPTSVMAKPMNRFFNYGQGSAAPVDFENPNTKIFEKLDGTLCILYWDKFLMTWCVGTRSVPDADLPMDGFGNQTFSDLFWKAFAASGGTLSGLDYAQGHMSFCFELCTPDNQIVVAYPDYKVYLLAAISLIDLTEDEPSNWNKQIGVELAPTFSLGSVDEMLNFVSSREPTKFEGVVVCDPLFRRVKMKNAGYLAYSKIKDSVAKSPRSVMEIVLLGKEDDVFPLVPAHIQTKILDTKNRLARLIHSMNEEYERIYSPDRKTFALAVQANSGHMGPHMARWNGRAKDFHDWLLVSRVNGSWSDSFLDSILRMCYSLPEE